VTLTLGVATKLLRSAYRLIMGITYQRFKIFFNTWPLNMTLAFGVASLLSHSAYHFIMVITGAKLFQIFYSALNVMEWTRNVLFDTWPFSAKLLNKKTFSGLKVMEQTRKCYGQSDRQTNGLTDRRTDRRKPNYNSLPAMRKEIETPKASIV
jgi:hypothetical protein